MAASAGTGFACRMVCRGFTLIELVVVLVLLGVLAVMVVPRMVAIDVFAQRGLHDQTLTVLRHAQKSAVAQRRSVCVVFSLSGATLAMDVDRNLATGSNGCEGNLAGPDGHSPGGVSARAGAQYATLPAGLVFDPLGRPNAAQTIQVAGHVGAVVVEPMTGFVHD